MVRCDGWSDWRLKAGRFGAVDRGAPRYNGRPDMPSLAASGLPQRLSSVAWLVAFAVGCTAILDIDHDYVVDGSAEGRGGGGVGGRGGTGGRSGGGGIDASSTGGTGIDGPVTGGASGAGGGLPTCSDGDPCGADQKCCNGGCVVPSPDFGCSLTACMPCPEPIANAEPLCDGTSCSARCMTGFVPVPGACVPEGTLDAGSGGGAGAGGSGGGSGGGGGIGGASGTGGAPTTCDPRTCDLCTNPALGIVPCCDRFTDQCGCSWFSVVYCVE